VRDLLELRRLAINLLILPKQLRRLHFEGTQSGVGASDVKELRGLSHGERVDTTSPRELTTALHEKCGWPFLFVIIIIIC
jgi:hypothetical protein